MNKDSCFFGVVFILGRDAFGLSALVAVAANFVPPFREMAIEFEKSTRHHTSGRRWFHRKFLFANQERRAVRRVLFCR